VLGGTASQVLSDALRPYARNFDWFPRAPVVVAVACAEPAGFLAELVGQRAAAVSGGRVSAAMACRT